MGNFQSKKTQVYREELLFYEHFWVDIQPFLLQHGYKLRARYQPSWKPSWKRFWVIHGTFLTREDGIFIVNSTVMDAVRISDGVKVVMKTMKKLSNELLILQYLNSEPIRNDPRNKTVPILDVLPLTDTDESVLVIMPMLMRFSTVPFRYVSEVYEAFEQFLTGLAFLHEHDIAHGDACLYNLMMDSSKVVPNGFHFARNGLEDGIYKRIQYVDRRSVAPVDYFLIDFGLSFLLSPGDERKCVSGLIGQDRTIPEMLTGSEYDPFQSDICQMGNVLKTICENHEELAMLKPLWIAMTLEKPEMRPTALQAYNLFVKIMSSLAHSDFSRHIEEASPS